MDATPCTTSSGSPCNLSAFGVQFLRIEVVILDEKQSSPTGRRIAGDISDFFATFRKWWCLPLAEQDGQLKAGKPEQFLKSQFDKSEPVFSPDGHWLAYVSTALGRVALTIAQVSP